MASALNYITVLKKDGEEFGVLASHATVDSRELIKVQLGNFPPNSRATLICHMYGELTYEALMEAYAFRMPLTYVPKYLLTYVRLAFYFKMICSFLIY